VKKVRFLSTWTTQKKRESNFVSLYRLMTSIAPEMPEPFGACQDTLLERADFTAMRKEIESGDVKRETLFTATKKVSKISGTAMMYMHRGEVDKAQELMKEALENLAPCLVGIDIDMRGITSFSCESIVKLSAFQHFLKTGECLAHATCRLAILI
jgi:hypothetical protein